MNGVARKTDARHAGERASRTGDEHRARYAAARESHYARNSAPTAICPVCSEVAGVCVQFMLFCCLFSIVWSQWCWGLQSRWTTSQSLPVLNNVDCKSSLICACIKCVAESHFAGMPHRKQIFQPNIVWLGILSSTRLTNGLFTRRGRRSGLRTTLNS